MKATHLKAEAHTLKQALALSRTAPQYALHELRVAALSETPLRPARTRKAQQERQ